MLYILEVGLIVNALKERDFIHRQRSEEEAEGRNN